MLSRLILLALVIINLLLFGWFMAKPQQQEHSENTAPSSPPTDSYQAGNSNIPELKLLSEAVAESPLIDNCATIGPLENINMVRRLRDRLGAYTSRIRERQTEARVERGYWVYLPVAESRDAALEYTNQLASMGISDYFVVTTGEMQNAVSVGLFNDIQRAEQRQRQLQALGFNTSLGARREYETHYWLDYQLLDDVESPWRSISASLPEIRKFTIQCWDD